MSGRSARLGESGAVAVWMAVSVAVMIGIIALSLDLGRAAITDTELKWASDAAALAGARQLDGAAGARDRARLAATGALTGSGVGLTANTDTFDSDADNVEVVGVKFLSTLGPGEGTAGDVEATTDANAHFIQVVVAEATVNNLFIQVVGGSDTTTLQESSVAGYGVAICQIPPLFICNPNETQTNKEVNLTPGMGILVKDGGGNKAFWGPGNYALLEIPGLPGVNNIREGFASLGGSPVCYDNLVTTEPGNPVAVNAGINVRFDMYKGATNGLKNDPNYYPSKNVVKGLGYGRGGGATKCDPATRNFNTWSGPGDPDGAELVQYPRDNCFYTGGCTRFGDGVWSKEDYCTVNYGNSQCEVSGTAISSPTGNEINTRYGFYRAEVESSQVPQQVSPPIEDVTDLCYTAKTWDGLPIGADVREEGFDTTAVGVGPDRRVLVSAVVNCEEQKALGNLNGKKTIPVAKWVLMFLTEAAGSYGDPPAQQELFLEVIRQVDVAQDDAIAHEIVQLYR